ncbi:MAG: DEAD/DEAH box helicase [Planctomycetota bacterium]|nr:DEAD/DEAH box helicase [Planctomycetota bacterium]
MTERSDAPRPRRRRRRRRSGRNQDQESGTETETTATDTRKPVTKAPPPVVDDPETFALDQKFSDLGLSEDVQKALEEKGFVHPTLIQSQMIPFALDGEDVLGQARTGTGKTAAFGLPALGMIEKGDAFAGMILVPTRELAIQVAEELKDFARHSGHQIVPVYGGQPIHKQVPKLEKRPEIIVGTPGRVMDMNERRHLPYDNVKMAILDEVYRMLDIGFRDDIRKILGRMSKKRQTIFVSATISGEIEKLARSYMSNPKKIVTTGKSLTVQQVAQSYVSVERWDKPRLLSYLIAKEDPTMSLVFCRTKRTVDKIQKSLDRDKIAAHAIHGDMIQGKRNRVIRELRSGGLKVLVCSDLASRGLDVDGITHVINYDLPEDPEIYVHRIGRTARAGRDGVAWSFVSPDQGDLLTAIEMLANTEIPRMALDDFKPGPVPSDVRADREHQAGKKEREIKAKSRHLTAEGLDTKDESKFPGGMVPKKLPPKRMMGRSRSGRR